MGLGEIQNLYAKTLDAQALFQQAVGQSEIALRQSERRGIAEARHKESMIDEETSALESQELSVDLQKRPDPEKLKRYRLNWFHPGQPGVEVVSDYPPSRTTLDIKA